VDVVRLRGCDHYRDAPGRRLDWADLTVILSCADCGESRIAISGELGDIIEELTRLRGILMADAEASAATEAEAGPARTDPADRFGRWLARQAPGSIQPPPRPPREARRAADA
jgi:hypothetical protein